MRKMLPPSNLLAVVLVMREGIFGLTLYHRRKQAMASGEMSAETEKTADSWYGEFKLAAVVETALLSEVELSEYCRGNGLYTEQVKA